MEKSPVNSHKAHMSPWQPDVLRRTWAPVPGLQRRARTARRPGLPATHRSRRWIPIAAPQSLNWSLRRYVRASSLRVWLMRRAAGAGWPARAVPHVPAGGRPGRYARRRGFANGRTACRGPGIAHCGIVLAETDKWNIWSRLRKAFEEVFGVVRLSLCENAHIPNG